MLDRQVRLTKTKHLVGLKTQRRRAVQLYFKTDFVQIRIGKEIGAVLVARLYSKTPQRWTRVHCSSGK